MAEERAYEPLFRSDANLRRSIFDHCGNRRLMQVRESIDTCAGGAGRAPPARIAQAAPPAGTRRSSAP